MIKTHNLTKKYGDLFAIRDIELDLQAGDVFGFIGPNGAGKTTTMRILATLLHPTWGEAYVCNHSIYTAPREIRRLVGYMPDFFGVYDDMKVIEYLEFFAATYRIRGSQRRQICDSMLEMVDLDFKRDALANTLSRGQTQRLGLARVLLHDPQVLLLDEPLSGLDPRARIDMRNLLRRLGQTGKTIIVSSHILPELADVCNKIGIIDRGVLITNESVSEVMKKIRETIVLRVRVTGDSESAARLLEEHDLVEKVDLNAAEIVATLKRGVRDYSELSSVLVFAGHQLIQFQEEETTLETAFMMLTGKKAADSDG